MFDTAKVFSNGRSQAVRLPAAYRFDTEEVFIRKDPVTGDVILSRRPENWDSFLQVVNQVSVPIDFLSTQERFGVPEEQQPERDPLDFTSATLTH
jgi:antitoxin VapB